ncbi:unnamed protein product [Lampetra planeri]
MGGGCGPGLVAIDGELERRRSSTRPAAGGKGVAGCCVPAAAAFPPFPRVGVPALPTAAFPPFSPRQCFRGGSVPAFCALGAAPAWRRAAAAL